MFHVKHLQLLLLHILISTNILFFQYSYLLVNVSHCYSLYSSMFHVKHLQLLLLHLLILISINILYCIIYNYFLLHQHYYALFFILFVIYLYLLHYCPIDYPNFIFHIISLFFIAYIKRIYHIIACLSNNRGRFYISICSFSTILY